MNDGIVWWLNIQAGLAILAVIATHTGPPRGGHRVRRWALA